MTHPSPTVRATPLGHFPEARLPKRPSDAYHLQEVARKVARKIAEQGELRYSCHSGVPQGQQSPCGTPRPSVPTPPSLPLRSLPAQACSSPACSIHSRAGAKTCLELQPGASYAQPSVSDRLCHTAGLLLLKPQEHTEHASCAVTSYFHGSAAHLPRLNVSLLQLPQFCAKLSHVTMLGLGHCALGPARESNSPRDPALKPELTA